MENEAGAPGASPAVTPTAACATSVVVPRPRSSIVCLSITSTAAGICRTVSPNREALSATTLVLRGVWETSPPPGTGATTGTAVAARERPATRAAVRLRCVPDSVLRNGLRCGDVTTTGPRLSGFFSACGAPCAMTGAEPPKAKRSIRPSGATDELNQRLIVTQWL